MSNKLNATVATMGIDIGKNSFHVVGLDRRGAIVLRQNITVCNFYDMRLIEAFVPHLRTDFWSLRAPPDGTVPISP